jgi:ABC-type transport system involved in multi-copper enzyme maturation permease subunit
MRVGDLGRVLGWLVRDTFRQSLASAAFWLILAMSALAIIFCLSVRIADKGPLYNPDDIELNPNRGHLQIGFGAFSTPLPRDDRSAVLFLQVLLAEWAAGTLGILLALLWTAGFVPSFLEATAVTVLLAKPVPRSWLLLGKVLGVLAFLIFQLSVFVLGTWLALALRTGVWDARYLLCLPLILAQFFALFSVSVLVAVLTRSTMLCVLASLGFWGVSYAVNYAHHAYAASSGSVGTFQTLAVEGGYWLLPKPTDMVIILHRLLEAGKHFNLPAELDQASVTPWLTITTSLGFGMVILALAMWRLELVEY